MAEYPEVYPAESISVSTPRVSSKMEVVEEIVVHKEDMMLPKSAVWEAKQSFRERSDEWFLLLDVVAKETAYVSPGTNCHQMSLLLDQKCFTVETAFKCLSLPLAEIHNFLYIYIDLAQHTLIFIYFFYISCCH